MTSMRREDSSSSSFSQDSYTGYSSSLASSASSFRSAVSSLEQSYEPYDQRFISKEKAITDSNMSMQRYELVPPPAVPNRNSRRSQIILLKQTEDDMERPLSRQSLKHEIYLSSEEDASSSAADEDDDYEFDSESEGSVGSSSWRRSQEITARAVSVIYSGKPIVVDLPVRSRSASLYSTPPLQPVNTRLRRVPAAASLTADRRSVASANPSRYSPKHERQPATFLSIDPLTARELSESPHDVSRPMTPTALLKRTFTFSKKNKSSTEPIPQPASSPDHFSFARRSSEASAAHLASASQSQMESLSAASASYQEIMKAARRNARVQPLPSTGNGVIHLNLGRKKSFKAL